MFFVKKNLVFYDFLTDFWVVSKSFPDIMLGFLGKRRLQAPETRIWTPEGALDRISYIKGPKRQFFLHFFTIFSAVFPNIWPLAGPNIAKKGGPLQKLARVDRQTHFGTFNFWLQPGFPI